MTSKIENRVEDWEIAVFVVHMLGGAGQSWISTGDVALRCFELAPHLVGDARYPKLPDYETPSLPDAVLVERALKIAIKQGLLTRTGKGEVKGWGLTHDGAHWIVRNEAGVRRALRYSFPLAVVEQYEQELDRFRQHDVFQRYLKNPDDWMPHFSEVWDLFRARFDMVDREKYFQSTERLALLDQDETIIQFVQRCRRDYAELIKPDPSARYSQTFTMKF